MPDSSQDGDALVERAIAGDADAFGELYLLHLDAIYRYVYYRVGNTNDAEDLTEQVFLKAWEALPGYKQRGNPFTSWLYRIAHNVVVDHHRRRKPTVSMPLSEKVDWESKQPTSLEQVIEAEEAASLAAAVAQLPEEQQQVIILRFVEGLNHSEVARILDKSQDACRVLQHRALVALNQLLNGAQGTYIMHNPSVRFEDILDDCILAIQVQGKSVADCLARYPTQHEELEPLLYLSLRLQAARTLKAPPEFRRVAAVRMRNLIAARPRRAGQTIASPSPLPNIRRRLSAWRRLPTSVAISVVLAVWLLIGGGTVYASGNALPGDGLYPVKRAIEAVQLVVSLDDTGDARLHLAFAARRLDEATALLKKNRLQNVEQALTDYEAQIESTLALFGESSDLSPDQQADVAQLLIAETNRHQAQLTALFGQAPQAARPAIEMALTVSQTGRNRALEAIGGKPDKGMSKPTATPTQTPTATPSPEPPTPTPSPEPLTATPSPKPPTPTPSPKPPTATPSPEPPTATPSPKPPTSTPAPTSPEWPIPTDWPPECPPPSERPTGWPPECPTPPEWPSEWPTPPARPPEWPAPPEGWPPEPPEEWPQEWEPPDVQEPPGFP